MIFQQLPCAYCTCANFPLSVHIHLTQREINGGTNLVRDLGTGVKKKQEHFTSLQREGSQTQKLYFTRIVLGSVKNLTTSPC